MPYKNPPPCQICGKPSAANKMCDMHYRRWKKYGNAEKTLRPADWGQKSKHPLWHSWKWTGRSFNNRVSRWGDFWLFVEDVGARPEKHIMRKLVDDEPFGPKNFYWAEPILKDAEKLDRANRLQKEWRKKNPIKVKDRYLKRQYGISIDEYIAMANAQNGVCAICGDEDEWFSLAVDHCHTAGHVRGLLCSQCNTGLGLFRDNPASLRRAAEYLDANVNSV